MFHLEKKWLERLNIHYGVFYGNKISYYDTGMFMMFPKILLDCYMSTVIRKCIINTRKESLTT